jgi:acyl-CoA reductase-like NAD-dependent aldehyde dehydrogenase
MIKAINPTTEEIIQEYDIISSEEIKEKVKNTKDVFNKWKKDIEESRFGKELSRYGMLEFTNIKSVRLYDKLVSKHEVG